jgi:hypothetical protein
VLLGLVRDRVGGGKFLIFISILWAARQINPPLPAQAAAFISEYSLARTCPQPYILTLE